MIFTSQTKINGMEPHDELYTFRPQNIQNVVEHMLLVRQNGKTKFQLHFY